MTDARDDTAAAELALGLLDGEERAGALRRLLAEPGFAGEVEDWRTRFALLFPLVPEVAPPADLLARVEASLDAPAATAAVVRPGRFWPSVAGLTSIAAAVLLTVLVTRPEPAPVPVVVQRAPTNPVLLAAAIVPAATGEPLTAVFDPAAGTLRLPVVSLADARHSAQLWVIGGDGVPHSLGLLRVGDRTAIAISSANRARLAAAAVLAVSIEPVGGSPTGAPTGPVVAKGTLATT
ncbi:anti-sigma factor [Sphingomonas sp.]|uniref:anti-sigma factor n=1 Tax=Sphingomonas sp. TaxID=28214 RepID=UPI003B004268